VTSTLMSPLRYEYRLRDGSRRFEVVYRTSNGVQRKKRGFRGTREAERYLNERLALVDRGQVVATRERFAAYVERWLREHRPRLEEGTYRAYRNHVDRRLTPFFGERRLSDISPADVRRYVAELADGVGGGARRPESRADRARALAAAVGELTAPALGRELGLSARGAHYLLRRLAAEGTLARTGRTVRLAVGRPAVVYRFVGPPAQAIRTDGAAPVGAKTINNSLSVLRVALEHALEDGLIARNPAATARGGRERLKLAEEHREMDFLRLREIPATSTPATTTTARWPSS
jgi:hypothetical protein